MYNVLYFRILVYSKHVQQDFNSYGLISYVACTSKIFLLKLLLIVVLGNGEIDFDEFVLLVERCSKPASDDQEIRDMFNAIDKDHSGFVDADELKETFVGLGIPLTNEDVRRMMKDAGVAEGSHIYYEGMAPD